MGVAKLKERKQLLPTSVELVFEMEEDLGFIGGQYIIIDSKMPIDEKKNYKRAYSIISSEKEQREFSLVYKVLDGGIVTNKYLKNLEVGEEIEFSGPWGKFLKDENYAKDGKVLMVATDTGIATALSFLTSSKVCNRLNEVELLWYVPSSDYFIDYEEVMKKVPTEIAKFEIIKSPEYGNGRDDNFYEQVEDVLKESDAKSFFLAGDGRVVKKGKELLVSLGRDEDQIGTKTYFNKEAN